MKFVKRILFMFALLAGLSAASMAQKGQDPKKPPPKDPPPVINPGKPNPPKGENKPKKPGGGQAGLRRKKNSDELT
jgi:hypothetical protein